jgi:two-component system response regulator YesN
MYNLFIADDEKLVIDTLQSIIKWEDYGIQFAGSATNGRTAYEEIMNLNIDIVIVDIRMPGMNGLEIIEKVKETKQDTIFIVCSGYSDFNYAKEAMKHGTVYYLIKPVDIEDLLDAVSIALNKRNELKTGDYINQLQTDKMLFESLIYDQNHHETDFNNFFVASSNIEDLPDYLNILDSIFQSIIPHPQQIKPFFNQNELIILFVDTSDYNMVTQTLLKLTQEIKEKLNIEMPWGVGANKPNAHNIHTSYIQSKKAYNYAVYAGERISNLYDIVYSNKQKMNIDYSVILEGLTATDGLKRTEAYIHSFIENSLNMRVNPNDLIYHCIDIINYVTNYFKQLYSLPPEQLYQQNYANIKHLNEVKNARLMGNITLDCLTNIIFFINDRFKDYKDKIISQIKEYVNENINTSISSNDIAKYINFNPSYISNFFKKKTGITLTDYITQMKMEKAKFLLSNNVLKINKIAEEVGYDDQRYFCLVFKKYCGLTPTKFRDRKN